MVSLTYDNTGRFSEQDVLRGAALEDAASDGGGPAYETLGAMVASGQRSNEKLYAVQAEGQGVGALSFQREHKGTGTTAVHDTAPASVEPGRGTLGLQGSTGTDTLGKAATFAGGDAPRLAPVTPMEQAPAHVYVTCRLPPAV